MNDNTVLTLKEWRGLKGYTKVSLASKSGVNERTIYLFEKDVNNIQNANFKTIKKLANALDIKVANIFLELYSEKPK
ncbi:helix-turn-helix transcriptional regulator [Staphylococcus xylosus]|uniref:helix-turn-helix transcriptional regulator n=1 Tax=Staphylococcus xylosus TaxID=1288 RepID=UPI001CDCF88E|nr:helix-turn-helix transcriptional regulator [Staphylococcus xylosus]MCQ3816674.1 XRE family transcriptional regulator [Staphylococcus xylosus]MCQ3819273.1 XRE family transcriptional regulator [Staphylococcus xylosus]UBV36700.1 helix-turn-helix transcriptional regulator [Staphylococcus xylosus]